MISPSKYRTKFFALLLSIVPLVACSREELPKFSPTAPSIPVVTRVTAANNAGNYGEGEVLTLHVIMSENVIVEGIPVLTLATGRSGATAIYSSGSYSSVLSFLYTVSSGDTTTVLNYLDQHSLTAGDGIVSELGEPANLTLPDPNAEYSLAWSRAFRLDTTAPYIVDIATTIASHTYKLGDSVGIRVVFSEAVNVDGDATLTLVTGSVTSIAHFASAINSSTLVFIYEIQESDTDIGVVVPLDGQLLGGASITDDAGALAQAFASGSPDISSQWTINQNGDDIFVDAQVPKVIDVSSDPTSGTLYVNDILLIRVQMSEAVTVSGTPNLTLAVGTPPRVLSYASSLSDSSTLVFPYTVLSGDIATPLDYAASNSLTLGRSIKDSAGNTANIALPAPGDAHSLASNTPLLGIDGSISSNTLTITAVTGDLSNACTHVYVADQTISIYVTFSNIAVVTGTPKLALNIGAGSSHSAMYSGGTGSSVLTFSYSVQNGDASSDLNYQDEDALLPNGGSIKNSRGISAQLTLPSHASGLQLADLCNLSIDTSAPSVVAVSTDVGSGTYKTNSIINVQIQMSEPVIVEGVPTLTLATNNISPTVVDLNPALSNATTLIFSYTVQSGDTSSALDVVNNSSLNAVLEDTAGNRAITLLTHGIHDFATLVIDGISARVVSVTSPEEDGSYGVNANLRIFVNMSETVVVTGTPTLEIALDSGPRTLNYTSTLNNSTLVFVYNVLADDNVTDLNYRSSSALQTASGAAVNDGAGNAASLLLPGPTDTLALGPQKNLVIDTDHPSVIDIVATNPEGLYNVGDIIEILVHMSESVTVTGVPRLTLETGGIDRVATFDALTDSSTLSFYYTVQVGDNANPLDYVSQNALTAGTRVFDGSSNDANLRLAHPGFDNSLAQTSNLSVDGLGPEIVDIRTSASNGTYKAGSVLPIHVALSEVSTVSGIPVLTLDIGGQARSIDYVSSLNDSVLVFLYTVVDGDTAAHLSYASTSALTAPDGIVDASGNFSTLELPAPNTSTLRTEQIIAIDTTSADVVEVFAFSPSGTYREHDVVDIRVVFDEKVLVTGIPELTLITGGSNQLAHYVSTSSNSVLVFKYTVGNGDSTADLNYIDIHALSAGTGTVCDVAGNDALLDLPETDLADTSAIYVDGRAPTVVNITSPNSAGTYTTNALIVLHVTMSESVTVTGLPKLSLNTGGGGGLVTYAGTLNNSVLVFNYNIRIGDNAAPLDNFDSHALSVGAGASIRDTASNDADLTLSSHALSNNVNFIVDTQGPLVVDVSTAASDGSYRAGQSIDIRVTMSEKVFVVGNPTLTLAVGGIDGRSVDYTNTVSNSILVFRYFVQAGDDTLDLDYMSPNALTVGTLIIDAVNNNAVLTLPNPGASNSLGSNKNIVIDTLSPTVTNVSSAPASRTYHAGESIDIEVTMSEAVTVSGIPNLTLATGSTSVAHYTSTTDNSIMHFVYVVSVGDTSDDLDYSASNALTAGTSVVDGAGNNAQLTLPTPGDNGSISLADNCNIVLDSTPPTVSTVSGTNGFYSSNAGFNVVPIFIGFSEVVTVTGTPQLTLETGATDRVAFYVSGSGTSILSLTYTVQATDASPDLNYVSISSFTTAGGTIVDLAGNDAITVIPSATLLSSSSAIVIDNTGVTVNSVTSFPNSGTYTLGSFIDVRVNFSEAVRVTGIPQITLAVGSNYPVNFFSGNTTSILSFRYTVQAGHTTNDLNYVATNSLTAASNIKDLAGNASTLTLALTTAAASLGGSSSIVIDTLPPSAPTGASATTQIQGVDVTWNAGGGQSGFLVVRNTGSAVSFTPTTGVSYTIGDNLGSGQVVSYVGTLTGLSDTGLTPGTAYFYKIFAYDSVFNYSSGITASATPRDYQWQFQAYLKAPNVGASDLFGYSVAIEGNTVVVGAPFEDSGKNTITNSTAISEDDDLSLDVGAAYVFQRTGTAWEQQAYIKYANNGNGKNNYWFGNAVSISGNTIAVGSMGEKSNQTTITNGTTASNNNTIYGAGGVYVYQRTGTTWDQQAFFKAPNVSSNDNYGEDVEIENDTMIVGSPFEDSNATTITNGTGAPNDESGLDKGAAYVYQRVGTSWQQQACLKAPVNNIHRNRFGTSVALSGNTAVVGAPTIRNNSDPGSVYVYTRTGSSWFYQTTLTIPTAPRDGIGQTVAINGDTISVGAKTTTSANAVHVFTRSGTVWTQQSSLLQPNVNTGDRYGHALAMNSDRVLVGDYSDDCSQNTITQGTLNSFDIGSTNAGSAYIFRRDGTSFIMEAYLKAPNLSSSDFFGDSVAISGNTVAVGAPQEDSTQTTITNGGSIPIIDSTTTGMDSGAVYIFVRQ